MISKNQEESCKHDARRSIFDEIRGVWIADETLSRVFDISSESKKLPPIEGGESPRKKKISCLEGTSTSQAGKGKTKNKYTNKWVKKISKKQEKIKCFGEEVQNYKHGSILQFIKFDGRHQETKMPFW